MKSDREISIIIHKEIMESFGKNIPDEIEWHKKLLIYLNTISLTLLCIIKIFQIEDCDIEKMMESIKNTTINIKKNKNMKTKEMRFKNGKKISDTEFN